MKSIAGGLAWRRRGEHDAVLFARSMSLADVSHGDR